MPFRSACVLPYPDWLLLPNVYWSILCASHWSLFPKLQLQNSTRILVISLYLPYKCINWGWDWMTRSAKDVLELKERLKTASHPRSKSLNYFTKLPPIICAIFHFIGSSSWLFIPTSAVNYPQSEPMQLGQWMLKGPLFGLLSFGPSPYPEYILCVFGSHPSSGRV